MTRGPRALLGRSLLVLAPVVCPALAVLAFAGTSHAEAPVSRTVEVVVAGEPADAAPLFDTVRELLGRQQLTVVRTGAGAAVLARVRVDLPATGSARVEVLGRADRVILRREVPVEGARAIAREAIAHLVQEAVESELLVAEGPPRPPRAEEPTAPPTPPASPDAGPPAPAPPPPPRPPATPSPAPTGPRELEHVAPTQASAVVLDVATFGGVGPVASGSGPVPRVGAGATVSLASRFRPALGASFVYAFPFERESDVVTARTSLLSARLLPSVEFARTEHFAFDALVGGGVDVLVVESRSESLPANSLGGSSTRASAIATVGLSTRIDVVPSVVFLASLYGDVDFVSRSYVVARGADASSVVAPWTVRPTLLLGFAFTALGPPSFTAAPAEGKRASR